MSPERKCGSVSGVSAESERSGNLDSHVYRFPVGTMEAANMRALQAAVGAFEGGACADSLESCTEGLEGGTDSLKSSNWSLECLN